MASPPLTVTNAWKGIRQWLQVKDKTDELATGHVAIAHQQPSIKDNYRNNQIR